MSASDPAAERPLQLSILANERAERAERAEGNAAYHDVSVKTGGYMTFAAI